MKCLIALCMVASALSATTMPDDLFPHFWSVAETLNLVTSQSFRPSNVGTLIEEGLKAMVNTIDAHSAFFTPESYKTTLEHTSGQFHGIGVSLMSKETESDTQLVVDVVCGGPADKAGIMSGDKIVEVGDSKLKGMSAEEVVARLKGDAGSSVSLTVLRDKKPLTFTLERDIIKDRSVLCYQFPTQAACYIALKTFSEKTPELVKECLQKAYQARSTSIILDLRKNAGGIVDAAVKTASLFLPPQSVVATAHNNEGVTRFTYTTTDMPLHPRTIPLFLLVDNFTASCSELLVGCLQHYATAHNTLTAFVVGMPTFGKGSVQEIIPLSNGCAVKLTTMLYALPSGTCIQAHGITPDFIVKPKTIPTHELLWVEDMYGKETSLNRHITREEALGKELKKAPTTKRPPQKKRANLSLAEIEQEYQDALSSDHALHMCLTLSNAYHAAEEHAPMLVTHCADALRYLKNTVITDEPLPITPL